MEPDFAQNSFKTGKLDHFEASSLQANIALAQYMALGCAMRPQEFTGFLLAQTCP